jgi:hypothetical protein
MTISRSILRASTVMVLAAAMVSQGCAEPTEMPSDFEYEVGEGTAVDGVAVAYPVAACLANPACAAAVAAALGYTVWSVSQLSGDALRVAQGAANSWFAAQRRGQTCNARCALIEANSSGGTGSGGICSGYVNGSGSSPQNAQRDANSRVPRGCRLKHCNIRCN